MSRRRLAPPPQSQAALAVIARSASADSGSGASYRLSVSSDGQPAAPAREAFSLVINPLPVHSILSRSLYPAEDA